MLLPRCFRPPFPVLGTHRCLMTGDLVRPSRRNGGLRIGDRFPQPLCITCAVLRKYRNARSGEVETLLAGPQFRLNRCSLTELHPRRSKRELLGQRGTGSVFSCISAAFVREYAHLDIHLGVAMYAGLHVNALRTLPSRHVLDSPRSA